MGEIFAVIIVLVVVKLLAEINSVAAGVFLGIMVAFGIIYVFLKPRDDEGNP